MTTLSIVDPMVKRLRAYIAAYEAETQRGWHKDAEAIIRRYKDERGEAEVTRPRLNILWSNVETLKPFLYSSTPKPIVSTRHDDAPEVARVAATLLERALTYTVAEEHFGSALRNTRDDYLLAGRGTAWVRYRPTFIPAELQVSESSISDDPAQQATQSGEHEDGTDAVQEIVGWEETITDYVHWRDFGHNVAPTWEEVDVVWRRVPMDRDALKARFGDDVGGKVPLDWRERDKGGAAEGDEDQDRAAVYECWWKSKRKAFWVTKTHPQPLDEKDDPLGLDHFFPCPRPIYATLSTDTLIPTPDFKQYRDQANAIDDLTQRISALTAAIKAAGVYDASVPALQRLLQEGHDNELIPVESWAGLSEKGGLKGAVELLPMQEIAETLLHLTEAREKQKADLYEVTGMSDIIRGNTAPEETATAQKIKANFASKRLAERQSAVERFASNVIAIMGNVIAVHFDQKTLAAMTGMKLLTNEQKAMAQQIMAQQPQGATPAPMQGQPGTQPSPPPQAPPQPAPDGEDSDIAEAMAKPTWEEVIQLLRDEPQRRFAITIETDSMVAPDDQAEQAARTQFLEAIGQFMAQAVPAIEQHPEMAPLLGHMLMFAVRGFRVGRDLDEVFANFVDKVEKKAQAAADAPPSGPPPDPQMAKVQGELQLKQQAQQFDQQQAQADQQHAQAMAVGQAQQGAGQQQAAMQLEAMKAHLQLQSNQQNAAMQAQLQQQQAQFTAQMDQFKALLDARTKIEVAEIAAGSQLQAAQIAAANQAEADDASV